VKGGGGEEIGGLFIICPKILVEDIDFKIKNHLEKSRQESAMKHRKVSQIYTKQLC